MNFNFSSIEYYIFYLEVQIELFSFPLAKPEGKLCTVDRTNATLHGNSTLLYWSYMNLVFIAKTITIIGVSIFSNCSNSSCI